MELSNLETKTKKYSKAKTQHREKYKTACWNWMYQRYPFRDKKALSNIVYAELCKLFEINGGHSKLGFPEWAIKSVLRRTVEGEYYLNLIIKGGWRYSIYGERKEEITQDEIERARELLVTKRINKRCRR